MRAERETKIALRDDLGRLVMLEAPACRVVSLVPSITETLFALGRGAVVVGATRYCTEPRAQIGAVERVGGTKNPDVARIQALQPDLVLVNPEENRKADFEAMQARGLRTCVLFPRRARDSVALLRTLGILTAAEATAGEVIRTLRTVLAECENDDGPPRARVFCPIWKNPWMSFNHDTYADDVLRLAGGDNVCRDAVERYCNVTLADVAARMPDIVLLPDEPYVFSAKDMAALQPLEATPAWRRGRVYCVDGKALSWYGARTAAGLQTLRRLLRPADAAGA